MKSGFSLISVVISMTLSTILMSAVFMIYNSIGRTSNFVKRVSDEDGREILIVQRLKEDFIGLASIWYVKNNAESSEKQAANAFSEDLQNKFFYSVNKNDSLEFLTFITTSALPAYATNGPHFVRVVYKLENDPANQGLLRLMRKESTTVSDQITETDLKNGSFSELANAIKSMKMIYFYFKKESNDAAASQEQNQKQSIQKLSDWNSANKETQEITKNSVPYAVQVDIGFENNQKNTTNTNFRISILADTSIKFGLQQPAEEKKAETPSEDQREPEE